MDRLINFFKLLWGTLFSGKFIDEPKPTKLGVTGHILKYPIPEKDLRGNTSIISTKRGDDRKEERKSKGKRKYGYK